MVVIQAKRCIQKDNKRMVAEVSQSSRGHLALILQKSRIRALYFI